MPTSDVEVCADCGEEICWDCDCCPECDGHESDCSEYEGDDDDDDDDDDDESEACICDLCGDELCGECDSCPNCDDHEDWCSDYEAEEDTCDCCGEDYAGDGDGWDGLCPSCADKVDDILGDNYSESELGDAIERIRAGYEIGDDDDDDADNDNPLNLPF